MAAFQAAKFCGTVVVAGMLRSLVLGQNTLGGVRSLVGHSRGVRCHLFGDGSPGASPA